MTGTSTTDRPAPYDLRAARLDLAGTRDFALPGAGEVRRAAIATATKGWLAEVYQEAVGERPGLALAAVGSLGRGDSGPLSDLDLVLLHDGRSHKTQEIAVLADRLWYPVWDAGLRLDHSVRTAGECRAIAGDDLVAAVGLLDLQLVVGDPDLVVGIRSTIAHDWRSAARKRLPRLVEAVRARHARHGEIAQSQEPDLKEGKGGLRDMTVLTALTQAWLTDRDRGRVDEAYARLLDVRDAIHLTTGRGRDRLLREECDAVAALMGHADSDDLLTEVTEASRTIAWALDAAGRRAGQSQRARTLRVGPRRPAMAPLGYGLFRHDGEAVLGSTQQVGTDAELPLRAAVVAARSKLPIAPRTLANLAASPDVATPWPASTLHQLTDLLSVGPELVTTWEALDQAGLVERWIPEWAAVRSRPQRNAVHRHTVDRHLVETVVEAARLSRDVQRPDLLLMAALLHDIGKVAGALDHSAEGATIAAGILQRLGMPADDAATVVLLVREHLTLMDTATRRDLDDPSTITAVVDLVDGELETFELLRALSIADSRAAGPKAWTDWRAGLLETLTQRVRSELAGEPQPLPDDDAPPIPTAALEALGTGHPFVAVDPTDHGWTVTVHDRDRHGLFADTAGVLAAHGLTVRRARLATIDGIAADTWVVESPGGDAPEARRIAASLQRLATGDRSALGALARRWSVRPTVPSTAGPTRAFVIPSGSDDATVLEVRTEDRPGLLHDLGVCLAQQGLGVRSAHIATHAGQTLDTFYVTLPAGGPLSPGKTAQVLSALIDACDGPPG